MKTKNVVIINVFFNLNVINYHFPSISIATISASLKSLTLSRLELRFDITFISFKRFFIFSSVVTMYTSLLLDILESKIT